MRPCGDKCGSMLLLVRACCLTTPWYYLNQCWLLVEGVRWHSPEINFTMTSQVVFGKMGVKSYFWNYCRISQGQWVDLAIDSMSIFIFKHLAKQIIGGSLNWSLNKSDCHLLGTNASHVQPFVSVNSFELFTTDTFSEWNICDGW